MYLIHKYPIFLGITHFPQFHLNFSPINIIMEMYIFYKGDAKMKKLITMSLVLIMIATTLVGCGGTSFEDGTHTGEAKGHNGPLKVEVVVSDGKITDVKVTEHEETEGLVDETIEQIPAAIVDNNSTDVDTIGGATVTGEAIIEAVNDALDN